MSTLIHAALHGRTTPPSLYPAGLQGAPCFLDQDTLLSIHEHPLPRFPRLVSLALQCGAVPLLQQAMCTLPSVL